MYFSIDDLKRGWCLKSDPSIATVVSGRFILSKSDAVPNRGQLFRRNLYIFLYVELYELLTDGNKNGRPIGNEPADVLDDMDIFLVVGDLELFESFDSVDISAVNVVPG